jgi:hypothetical protein
MLKKEKTTTITSVIDVVGALATDSLDGQVYFMDTNKENGSKEQGTDQLKTMVSKGDRLVWIITPLECEAYAAIEDITIDISYCKPERNFYDGTNISYWVGTVKKNVSLLPYSIKFKVGTRDEPIATTSSLCLIG